MREECCNAQAWFIAAEESKKITKAGEAYFKQNVTYLHLLVTKVIGLCLMMYKDPVYWLRESLDTGKDRSEEYHTSEQLLGLNPTDYYELDGLIEDYSSYFKLWDQVIRFQEQTVAWTTVPI